MLKLADELLLLQENRPGGHGGEQVRIVKGGLVTPDAGGGPVTLDIKEAIYMLGYTQANKRTPIPQRCTRRVIPILMESRIIL